MFDRVRAARQNKDGGFTLIELLIVIVILGILAAVVVFSVRGIQDRGQAAACKADITTIQTAEEANFAKNNKYGTLEELKTNGFIRELPAGTVAVDDTTGAVTGIGVCA